MVYKLKKHARGRTLCSAIAPSLSLFFCAGVRIRESLLSISFAMQTYSSTAKTDCKGRFMNCRSSFLLTDDRPVPLLYWALQIYTDGSLVQIFLNY